MKTEKNGGIRAACRFPDAATREKWLCSDDEGLRRECRFQAFKATGPGGQHRNKVSSAVRVEHLPTGLVTTSVGSRCQHRNRHDALRKLRLRIAWSIRSVELRVPGTFDVALTNPIYPVFVASLLDALDSSGYELKESASTLGISPSKLAKTLARDPELWQEVNLRRNRCGLPPLQHP